MHHVLLSIWQCSITVLVAAHGERTLSVALRVLGLLGKKSRQPGQRGIIFVLVIDLRSPQGEG